MRLRYVVLRHEGVPEPHFDLMIEAEPGGSLMTWRLKDWPVTGPGEAFRLSDHRREYLNYEGEVSGGRGSVKQIACGEAALESGTGGGLIRAWLPGERGLNLCQDEGERWRIEPTENKHPHRP